MRLAEIQDTKIMQKNRHLRTIAQIVGLYLRNLGTYRQSKKNC